MSEANILVVADDLILRRTLRIVLSAKGYRVTNIDSNEDAPNFCGSGKYDLVLVDDELYDRAFVRICKEIKSISGIPMIVMTGDAPDPHARYIGELVHSLLRKPFGISELFACLQDSIKKSTAVSTF
jgi:DNA-binding response OmpR family regulator